jgi:hypothetical protein
MKIAHELEGDDLLDALGIEVEEPETGGYTPRQERLIAGFEDVLRFRETNGTGPEHGVNRDIFERIYAVRLDQLRKQPEEDLALLRPLDHSGLLTVPNPSAARAVETLSPEELLEALAQDDPGDIGTLVHVQSVEARREAAEYVADRVKCEDFDLYRPLFQAAEADLAAGRRTAKRFEKEVSIEVGDFFILSGQMVYVAAVGETFRAPNGGPNARLKAIYSNGTESNLLLWSLQRALYRDENGRRLTNPSQGPLFGDRLEDGDVASATIYVLRSLSKDPKIAAMRDVLHKIGVTSGRVEDRICNAERDATYLLAPVEIVATWKLANIRHFKFEQTIHRILASAQLQLHVPDRFGIPVEPKEWFVVPLPVINEIMERIQNESITEFVYDSKLCKLRSTTST